MLYGAKRVLKKLFKSWPGRLLTITFVIFLIISIVSSFVELRNDSKQSPMTSVPSTSRRGAGHRWRQRSDKPTLLADIIPADQDNTDQEERFKKVAARMSERQAKLKAGCKKHGLDVVGKDPLHQVNPWEYFINRERKFVWCNVFKSASSSWMYVFNILAGYGEQFLKKTKRIPLTLARDRYPRPSSELLQSFLQLDDVTSLLIARHPFERLVSSYKDKIAGALPGSLHDKMRRKITLKYRPPEDLPKDNRGVPVLPRVRQLPSKYVPTFAEFVRYIVEQAELGHEPDMHWAPVYSFCNPCQVNINTIAKVETMDEDTEYILQKIKVSKGRIDMSKKNQAPDGKSASDVANGFLKSIGSSLYAKILKLYIVDFDIFGYVPKAFSEL